MAARMSELLRFWVRFGLPVALATLVSLGLTGVGMWRAATRSDAISVERQQRVAVRAVALSIAAVSHEQQPDGIWDDAVKKARPPFDPVWFKTYFSTYFQKLFGSGQVYILDARDRPIYGAIEGSVVPAARFEAIRPSVTRMIDEVRGRAGEHGGAQDQLEIDPAKAPRAPRDGRGLAVVYAAHLERILGRPASVSIMRIAPNTRVVSLTPGREPLLVTLRYLDRSFLGSLATDHLIDHARIADANTPRAGEASLALRSPERQAIGWLIWRPELPGTRLLEQLAPLAAVSGLLTIAVMALLGVRLRGALRKLADGEARARHDAMHDPLTGLPNRVLFADRLDTACALAGRGEPAALLLLDLDRFKAVNDTLGHAAGDGVLREFARRVRSLLRASDTVARFGGDEFGIILPDTASREAVEALCRMILAAAARPFGLPEGVARAGVSIGIALLPEAGMAGLEVMRAADRALYWAKAEGRGHFRLFNADPTQTQTPVFTLMAVA